MVQIVFDGSANRESVSPRTLKVIESIAVDAGVEEIVISSTQRTARDQARAMYENCRSKGVASQLALYAAPGQAIVRVYAAQMALNQPPDKIIDAMTRAIVGVGPSRVSRHCADPSVLNVVDIRPSRMPETKHGAFVVAVQRAIKAGTVSKFLGPPNDPAFHLEIPQRP